MNIYLLDGKDMTSRDKTYRIIKRTIKFPDYFGHNLDALADCLSELPGKETAIVFVNTDALAENLGPYADKIIACFRSLSEESGYTFIEKA